MKMIYIYSILFLNAVYSLGKIILILYFLTFERYISKAMFYKSLYTVVVSHSAIKKKNQYI